MLFEIGQYRLDIDVPKTRQFYETADVVSKSCSCDGCLNFERAVSKLPPVIMMEHCYTVDFIMFVVFCQMEQVLGRK